MNHGSIGTSQDCQCREVVRINLLTPWQGDKAINDDANVLPGLFAFTPLADF